MTPDALERRLRTAVLIGVFTLIVLLILWRVMAGLSVGGLVLIVALTLPLWIALPRLLAGQRRTYAWMTLAITPYLILGITEAVADPPSRIWAALCLLVALTLFALLVSYLRVTRDPGKL